LTLEAQAGPSAPDPRMLQSAWRGFQQLRSGSGLVLAANVIALLVLIAALASLASMVPRHGPAEPADLEDLINQVGGILVAVLAGLALAFIVMLAGFLRMLSAAGSFASLGSRFQRGATGSKLIIGGIGVDILGLLLLAGGAWAGSLGLAVAGAGLVLLGSLAVLVGWIMFSLFISSLSELSIGGFRAPDGFKTAGILLLIGIVLNMASAVSPTAGTLGVALDLVAFILIYVYSGQALEELRKAARGLPVPLDSWG